jgi:hypothetical protein
VLLACLVEAVEAPALTATDGISTTSVPNW